MSESINYSSKPGDLESGSASPSPPGSPVSSTHSGLPQGTRSFKSSRSSLKMSPSPALSTASAQSSQSRRSDYSSAYRRKLAEKKVAVMPDGKFTFECPETEATPDSGIPRRHPLCQDAGLITSYHPEIKTLRQSFLLSVQRNAQNRFLGTREKLADGVFGEYTWKTYGEVNELINCLVGGMLTLGLRDKSAVGLFSVNREEWIVTEQACFANSYVTVPLYDTLGNEAIAFICNQVEMEVVFTSGNKLPLLLKMLDSIPTVKYIVSFDPISQVNVDKKGVQLIEYAELMTRRPNDKFTLNEPTADDLCTICYTSGTMGLPKGVMLPHAALLADASACLALCGYGPNGFAPDHRSLFELNSSDVHISYLPLAHIFERIVMTALTTVGAGVGFYQGDTLKILEDLAVLKPTIFVSVPRLLSRVYDKIKAGVKEKDPVRQFLFNWAYASKLENLHKDGSLTHWLWDRLVFSEIKAKFGGRLRAILSGSAPISPEVMDFLRICFSCEVYEGYGQTETSAGTCLTIRHDWTTGHVGIPAPCNEIKLVSVPEMHYFANDPVTPRGEICVRGPNCFTGYYRDEEKTRETLDDQGWVHSGDIGEWDARGRLKIIDRKKNIFKLSQGEFVAPERVEAVLTKSNLIAQCFLYGDSLESACLAVIVPDKEELKKWIRRKLAKEDGGAASNHASRPSSPNPEEMLSASQESVMSRLASLEWPELCADPAIYALINAEIQKFGTRNGGSGELKGFEMPKAIYLESEPFSLDNGLLTATFKLKRNEAKAKYLDIFNRLYRELKSSGSN